MKKVYYVATQTADGYSFELFTSRAKMLTYVEDILNEYREENYCTIDEASGGFSVNFADDNSIICNVEYGVKWLR